MKPKKTIRRSRTRIILFNIPRTDLPTGIKQNSDQAIDLIRKLYFSARNSDNKDSSTAALIDIAYQVYGMIEGLWSDLATRNNVLKESSKRNYFPILYTNIVGNPIDKSEKIRSSIVLLPVVKNEKGTGKRGLFKRGRPATDDILNEAILQFIIGVKQPNSLRYCDLLKYDKYLTSSEAVNEQDVIMPHVRTKLLSSNKKTLYPWAVAFANCVHEHMHMRLANKSSASSFHKIIEKTQQQRYKSRFYSRDQNIEHDLDKARINAFKHEVFKRMKKWENYIKLT
jgi:hypothetical protein